MTELPQTVQDWEYYRHLDQYYLRCRIVCVTLADVPRKAIAQTRTKKPRPGKPNGPAEDFVVPPFLTALRPCCISYFLDSLRLLPSSGWWRRFYAKTIGA